MANLLLFLPYLITGMLPFVVGTLLAGVSGYPVRLGVAGAGALGLAALILAAALSREVHAPKAGGLPPWPGLSLRRANHLAYAWLALAALIGLLLQLSGLTGEMTIPLGALGLLGGYFLFAPPLELHRRGLGEAAGALGYGVLPTLAGYYLQSGHLVAEIFFFGLPLTFAAFNVFLIHGFPPADGSRPGRPGSLAERLGPGAGALIYSLANVLIILGLILCLWLPASPLPFREALWVLMVLAVVNQELIKRKAYRSETRLKLLRWLTLGLHLGMGVLFALMAWPRVYQTFGGF